MGREIRRVPPNWDHPIVKRRFGEGYQPMYPYKTERKTMNWYILDENKNPVRVANFQDFSEMFDNIEKRRVAFTDFGTHGSISTVFLGMDHAYGNNSPPVLFESMIFGGPYADTQERYCTYKEALEGHQRACQRMEQFISQDSFPEGIYIFDKEI